MRKKFKKRLLGIILTILMVVSVIPVQQVQPVKAAGTLTLNKGDKIYFKVISRDSGTFGVDNAVPAVQLKTSDTDNSGTWQTMTEVPGESDIYQYVVDRDSVTHVAFRRVSPKGEDWHSMTSPLEINGNMYTSDGWDNSSNTNSNSKNWCTYSGGNDTPKTTGTYYAKADFVDYYNDARIDNGNPAEDKDNNQGNATNDMNALGGAVPFSYFNGYISDNYSGDNTIPLYFGSLLYTNNRVKREHKKDASYTSLNRWNTTANVALTIHGQSNGQIDTAEHNTSAPVQVLVKNELAANGGLCGLDGKELPFFSKQIADTANIGGTPIMKYFSDYQFPFVETKKGTVKTYSYDSATDYAVYIDQNNPNDKIVKQSNNKVYNVTQENGQNVPGYFPFNEAGATQEQKNYGFGTKFTIPFTVNENGTIDGQENGDALTFDFTGDDDVWVFLDGKLILDMGGAHGKATGSINFKTLQATVKNAAIANTTSKQMVSGDSNDAANYANGKGLSNYLWDKGYKDSKGHPNDYAQERSAVETEDRVLDFSSYGSEYVKTFKDASKVHTLTMFYMERGMYDSNMKIQFTINPLPSGLSVSKQVDTKNVNEGLKTAAANKDAFEFTMMKKGESEENLTNVSDVNYSFYDGKNTSSKTIGADGKIKLKDKQYANSFENANGTDAFKPGEYFNITEKLNNNYTTKWFVTDYDKKTEELDKPVEKGEDNVAEFKFGEHVDEFSKANYNVNFVNTPKVGTVNITKAWKGDIPDTLRETEFPFKVEVDLDGADGNYGYSTYALKYTVDGQGTYTTEADGSFKLKCDQTAAFEGIPAGAKVKVTETKTTDDKSWEVSGSNVAESTPVTEVPNQTLTITNATKTITSNKVIYVEAGKDTFYKPANVETGYTVSKMSDGLTYTDKGFNGAEPNKSYTANYTGSNSDGAIVNGTITVLTYQATDKVYVFDYGLESNIADTSTGNGLFQGGTFYNDNAKDDMATTAKLGTITPAKENTQTTISGSNIAIDSVGKADSPVTFKPVAFMDKDENYTYTADITKKNEKLDPYNPETGTTVNGKIKTMPASVVYYEDNFNATNENEDSSVKIVYTKSKPKSDPTYSQSNDQSENYGHDDAYKGDLEESGNSATEMNNGDGAYFTFTGDGFDIVSRTNEHTAGLIAYVYNGKKDATFFSNSEVFKAGATDLVKSIPVDTYYSNGDLYQVPVISTTLEKRGTYTVYLKALRTYTGQSVIYIDGVRIYNPLADKSAYLETEKNTKVQELRGMLLGSSPSINLVTPDGNNGFLIDGGSTAVEQYLPEKPEIGAYLGAETLADVMKAGPNNELYLPIDNGVAFKVSTPVGDADWTLQVGAKSVSADKGTEDENSVEANKAFTVYVKPDDASDTTYKEVKRYTINTSTDMYYDIDLKGVIEKEKWNADFYDVIVLNTTADEEWNDYDIISLTNIKSAAGMTLSKPSQLTKKGYNLAGRNVLTGNDEAVLSAKFGVTNVTRGKYASMTVVTKKEATDVQVTDPTGAVVTSFTKKTSSIDADGNKEWKLTFKVIKQRGEAKYSVDAVVNGSLTNMPYSTSIMVR